MVDLSRTIEAKSDQMNSDDLLAGPVVIVVTKVTGHDDPQQPISIHYEGDNGKPWKPCKSMRRVLVKLWGPDGREYAGRALKLYTDPEVTFGKIKTGGIRIHALSHIEQRMMVALQVRKGTKAEFWFEPLRKNGSSGAAEGRQGTQQDSRGEDAPQTQNRSERAGDGAGGAQQPPDKVAAAVNKLIGRIEGAKNPAEVETILDDQTVIDQRDWLRDNRTELWQKIEDAIAAARPAEGGRSADQGKKAANPFDDDDGAGGASGGTSGGKLGPESWDATGHMEEIAKKELIPDVNKYIGSIIFDDFTDEAEQEIRMAGAKRIDELMKKK